LILSLKWTHYNKKHNPCNQEYNVIALETKTYSGGRKLHTTNIAWFCHI